MDKLYSQAGRKIDRQCSLHVFLKLFVYQFLGTFLPISSPGCEDVTYCTACLLLVATDLPKDDPYSEVMTLRDGRNVGQSASPLVFYCRYETFSHRPK